MVSIEDYQCEHLFLLIGSNPLPNYVAAKLLTQTSVSVKPKLYLIHSGKKESGENTGTSNYADYLYQVLGDGFDYKFITVEESKPRSIVKAINQYFPKSDSGRVGLHYTGGTKTMAVHAYLTVQALCKDRGAQFSYLNSRQLEMCFDPLLPGDDGVVFKLGDPQHQTENYHFQDTSIELAQLLALHGLKPRQPQPYEKSYFHNPRPSAWLFDLAKCLFDISLNNAERNEWSKWVDPRNGELAKFMVQCERNNRRDKSNRHTLNWGQYRQTLRTGRFPLLALPKLKQQLQALNLVENDELVLAKYGRPAEPPIDYFGEWLRGKWLEDYVLQQVLNIKDRCSLHDCGSGVEPALPGEGNEQKPFFEIDVIALRGYQLFAISCTLSNDFAECKRKLFEVYVRARQLGGDEARLALVCMVSTAPNLQSQLEQEWNIEKGKIKVFGKTELPNLEGELQKWFQGKD